MTATQLDSLVTLLRSRATPPDYDVGQARARFETTAVFLGGAPSHAFTKGPMLPEPGAAQVFDPSGTYATEVDASGMLATLESEGLSAEDRALVQSFGFSEAQLDDALGQVGSIAVPGPVSWAAVLDAARGSFETMRPALVDLVAQAEDVRAENEPLALRAAPVAEASAPPAAVVGEPFAVSASAVHLDPDATLAYAWDLDGDGEFDDAVGSDVDHVAAAPGLVVVAVEVSDGSRRDIAMASIMVSVGNVAPELTSFTPTDYSPFADVGETVDLQVTAEDADGDVVTLSWFVDDAPAGEGEAFAFEMPDQELHRVRVVAADDDPYSADAAFTFHVRSSIWQDQVGDTDGGSSGGVDDTAGGADGTASGGGNEAGATDGNDGSGTAGSGSAGADGGEGGSGCGCTSGGSTPGWAGLLMLVLGVRMRRRRR